MQTWHVLDGIVGTVLWAVFLTALFALLPVQYGKHPVQFAILLFLLHTARGAKTVFGDFKNAFIRQSLYIDSLERQAGFNRMVVEFLQAQMQAIADNAFLGRIRESLEHTPVDEVKLLVEASVLKIRLTGGNVTVDIEYNDLVKDFEGTLDAAKEDFLDKYHAED